MNRFTNGFSRNVRAVFGSSTRTVSYPKCFYRLKRTTTDLLCSQAETPTLNCFRHLSVSKRRKVSLCDVSPVDHLSLRFDSASRRRGVAEFPPAATIGPFPRDPCGYLSVR